MAIEQSYKSSGLARLTCDMHSVADCTLYLWPGRTLPLSGPVRDGSGPEWVRSGAGPGRVRGQLGSKCRWDLTPDQLKRRVINEKLMRYSDRHSYIDVRELLPTILLNLLVQ